MMATTLLVFGIVLITQSVHTQKSPIISYISRTQIVDIGGTASLLCSVQYAEGYRVLWTKVDHTTNSSTLLHDSRFDIHYDEANSIYTLHIRDIEDTDAGYYQCQVILSLNDKISAEVELQVRTPPIIFNNSTRSVGATEGEDVQLECYSSGHPPPRMLWRRQDNLILPTGEDVHSGNQLLIKKIQKEDRGVYICVAENGVGRGTKRNIDVQIEFAPVVTVPFGRLNQSLQHYIDLPCHIEAYPPPAIIWYKDDIQLLNSQHYSISHFATADEVVDSILRVITIEKRHYGNYRCKAANKLGSDLGYIELFESIENVTTLSPVNSSVISH